MLLRQLPANGTDKTRVLVSLDGEVRNLSTDTGLISVPVDRASPIREFYAWQHKRNYEGHWFSTTTGTLLCFESLLERQFLLSADFDPTVTAISAQPLAILWPANTASENGRSLRSHVPDFFCRHADGNGRLIDVRRPGHTDDPHFQLAAQLCAEVGWEYTVFSGLDETTAANLTWLSGYRTRHYAPAEATTASIQKFLTPGFPLRTGVEAIARHNQTDHNAILGNILHLLFHGKLSFDITQRLTFDALIYSSTSASVTP